MLLRTLLISDIWFDIVPSLTPPHSRYILKTSTFSYSLSSRDSSRGSIPSLLHLSYTSLTPLPTHTINNSFILLSILPYQQSQILQIFLHLVSKYGDCYIYLLIFPSPFTVSTLLTNSSSLTPSLCSLIPNYQFIDITRIYTKHNTENTPKQWTHPLHLLQPTD
mgnify:CR=1 FL=1